MAISQKNGTRLAELGFLLILFAGVWLVAAEIPRFDFTARRKFVAGAALALAGLSLIVATHWGKFG